MAYAVVNSLAQTIHQILNHDHNPLSVNVKQQIMLVHEQAILIRKFLEKFPDEAKSLERRIREAANGAEDVIEHFMYEHSRSSGGGRATDIEYDFGELKMVMAEIDSIAGEATRIKMEHEQLISDTLAKQPAPSWLPMIAPTIDSDTVGLEKDLEKIKILVCEDSTYHRIIPITGMAGIGKTTLAKNVYHDQSVMEKFPVRAWVTVSQDDKPENIFANLLCYLQSVVGEGSRESNGSNKDKLFKILAEWRYLIVFDDVWNKKTWREIRMAFPDSGNGSRIVITTRNESIAFRASFLNCKMDLMGPNQSWKLLKEKVFPDKECPPELEKVGKDIANGCLGVPLAIVVIARILSTISQTRSSWEQIAESVRSLIQKDVQFQKRIYLSYTNLPHHLRPCLLYTAGFPEDYEIRVSRLIKLWIAEGFVGLRRGKLLEKKAKGFVKDEEEAETYLNNLVERSLALVTTTKSNGKIKSVNLHNFIRDSCRAIALDENFERRLSNAHPDLRCIAKAYASTLRSVICFRPTESSLLGLRKLRLLRVLDVVDTHAYSLPPQVFDLFHLRYLALGCSIEIPAAISRLQNLRTLIIRPSKGTKRHSKDEVYLPLEVWMLPLLAHLVSFVDLLPNPEGAASSLENLLTLSIVKNMICTRKMVDMISNVKKLGLTYSGDKVQEDYQLNNLALLHQLEKLTLVLKADHHVSLTVNPVFPKKLRKLTLSGWRLSWDYMGIIGSLPQLQVLKLRDHACKGGSWETKNHHFRKLEYLHIDSSDLEEWATEFSQFPRLRRLVIHRCPSLSKIPDYFAYRLKLIEVDYSNQSLVECVKQIQEHQSEYYENDSLQVLIVN